jgi:hypothetical protein
MISDEFVRFVRITFTRANHDRLCPTRTYKAAIIIICIIYCGRTNIIFRNRQTRFSACLLSTQTFFNILFGGIIIINNNKRLYIIILYIIWCECNVQCYLRIKRAVTNIVVAPIRYSYYIILYILY